VSDDIKDKARKRFRKHLSAQNMAMGSSQGTCEGCAACLDEFGVSHGDVGNRPAQWLDPLTMSGVQGNTPIIKPDSHHAIFVAFKYLVRPE
jgi:hypothetical protein